MNPFLSLSPEGLLVLVVVMLPLSLIFMVALLRSNQDRHRELKHLAALRARLSPLLDSDDPPDAEETAEELREATAAFPERSAVRRAVVAVTRARTLATPDLQAAAQAIGAANEATLAGVRNVPNLLMLAGLLGTVLGLAGSIGSLVQPIRSAATASDPGALAGALANTMSVMRAAFGVSLWGILLSLASGALYALAARKQEALQDELQVFVHAELVPAVFPRAITGQMERMGRYLRDAGNSFQDIHTRLKDVAGQLETVLGRAGDTLDHSLSKLDETSGRVSQVFESMDGTVAKLTDGLQQGVGDLVQAQEAAATSLRVNTRELSERVTQQATVVERLSSSLAEHTERLLARVDTVGEGLSRASGQFEKVGETIRAEQSNYAARLDRNFETLTHTLSRAPEPSPAADD